MTSSLRATAIARFAGTLRDLRVLAGNPSYAELRKIDDRLARSTVSDVLTGKSPPSLDVLLRFVAGTLAYAVKSGIQVDEFAFDARHWQEEWIQLQKIISTAPSNGQAATHRAGLPRQLPRYALPFVGRSTEMSALDDLLLPRHEAASPGRLVILEGPPGVGKTALAVRWAHKRAEQFPDGQVFIDLQGFAAGSPRSVVSLLHFLLHSLEADMPSDDVETLSASFRSATADRRLLLIFDNAADASQLRPLMPGGSATSVIITSRRRMSSLTVSVGAQHLSIRPLTTTESLALLNDAAGRGHDTELLARVAEICGHLPLALRIAAERLTVTGPATAEAGSTTALLDTDLEDPSVSLRNVFSWSVAYLDDAAKAAFPLLSLLPAGSFELHAVAALIGVEVPEAEDVVSQLLDLHLLEVQDAGRLQIHDLLKAFSAARASGIPVGDRTEAIIRLAGWYEATAWSAAEVLMPVRMRTRPPELPSLRTIFPDYDAAFAWCVAELPSMQKITAIMCDLGRDDLACEFAISLLSFFNIRKPWSEWVGVFTLATAAAQRLGDQERIGGTFNGLGIAYRELRDDAQAIYCYGEAAQAYDDGSNARALSMVENNLGVLANERDEPAIAQLHFERAFTLLKGLTDPWRTSIVAHNLAEAELALRLFAEAEAHARQALNICRDLEDEAGVASALTTLGLIQFANGALDEAIELFRTAAASQLARGERQAAAISQRRLGSTLVAAGYDAEGKEALRSAHRMLVDLGDPLATDVQTELADLSR